MSLIAPTLQAFFTERLITQRNASPQTIAPRLANATRSCAAGARLIAARTSGSRVLFRTST